MFECYASEKKWYGRSFTRFFLGKFGDSNLTERNSRRSGAGVFGVDCTSDGSDLKRPASFGYSRRIGCGVPPGDQIPIPIQIYEEKKTKIFRFIIYDEKRHALISVHKRHELILHLKRKRSFL